MRVNKNIPKEMIDHFYDIIGEVIEYSLGTSLINEEMGELFDTLEDAKEYAEDNSEKRDDNVDDWNDNPEGC